MHNRRVLGIALLLLFLTQTVSAEEFLVGHVETFTTPDSGLSVLEKFIESANTSLYVNVYTFTSYKIASFLLKDIKNGVSVYIIVEGSPVGGIKVDEKNIISELKNKGAKVYLFNTKKLRYNHAKYVVADNTTLLVVTENFGQSAFSTSRKGNRGWGAVIYDKKMAENLANLFFSDLKFSQPYKAHETYYFKSGSAEKKSLNRQVYNGIFIVKTAVAPENALNETLELINSANRSLYVEQFYAYKYFGRANKGSVKETPNLFLKACLEAARRGVDVKIILDSTWYNTERENPRSNFYTVEYLNRVAHRENLNLQAKLGCFSDGIKKYHVKGLVVDNEAVMLGSMNWNLNSPTKNREVDLIIYGKPAGYFTKSFMHDWKLCSEKKKNKREVNYSYIIAGSIIIFIFMFRKRIKRQS